MLAVQCSCADNLPFVVDGAGFLQTQAEFAGIESFRSSILLCCHRNARESDVPTI